MESPLSTNNLWIEILSAAIAKLSLSLEAVDLYARKIDLLVSRRNEVAHGKGMAVTNLESYLEYEDAAMLVMMELALRLSELLHSREYLRV